MVNYLESHDDYTLVDRLLELDEDFDYPQSGATSQVGHGFDSPFAWNSNDFSRAGPHEK